MTNFTKFVYPSRGPGRPQVLLLGNGLEYKSGQVSWEKLLENLTVDDSIYISKEQRDSTPFPLLYHLLSTHSPVPAQFSASDIQEEEMRLAKVMKTMRSVSNEFLDILPTLNADHIFTTNYSYCIEKAFYPHLDFMKSSVRCGKRFRLEDGKRRTQEVNYKLHSGYIVKSSTRETGVWHIHGECTVPQGIVLGHDRYGRLLQRIETVCGSQRYLGTHDERVLKEFNSWPELFLYADVYILGLKLSDSEFDMWWLLRRKQRERYADGKVYFYERQPEGGYDEPRHLLLQANGVQLCDAGCTTKQEYDLFYKRALEEIGNRIAESRKGG